MNQPRIPKTIAPDLLHRLRERFHPWPLIQDWNLSIEEVQPGKAMLKLQPGPRTINGPRGNVNGGVLATMADMVCALALCTAFDGSMPFATSDLHIRYLEPAMDEVVAEANVLRLSKSGAVLECRLKCRNHTVVLCTAHFSIKPNLSG